MQNNSKIYIIIPTFNEAPVLRRVIFPLLESGFSVILIDDGSTDNRWDVLSDLNIFYLKHDINLGHLFFVISLIFIKMLSSQSLYLMLSIVIFLPVALFMQRVVPYARIWLFLLPVYFGFVEGGITLGINVVYKRYVTNKNVSSLLLAIILSCLLCAYTICRQQIHYNE